MNSLDPRVNRLPAIGQVGPVASIIPLDQFATFEVFVRPKEGKPFQHEGIVHAPDSEMAFVLAKETFTRRFTCVSLCVVETRHIFASPLTEGDESAYSLVSEYGGMDGADEPYEIYHLMRRGKQHIHAGTVQAANAAHAMARAKREFGGKTVLNVWAIRVADIRFTSAGEKDLWNTLPEKKFRDASDYKGGEKLKEFLERTRSLS